MHVVTAGFIVLVKLNYLYWRCTIDTIQFRDNIELSKTIQREPKVYRQPREQPQSQLSGPPVHFHLFPIGGHPVLPQKAVTQHSQSSHAPSRSPSPSEGGVPLFHSLPEICPPRTNMTWPESSDLILFSLLRTSCLA
jgi:hypothetical protein